MYHRRKTGSRYIRRGRIEIRRVGGGWPMSTRRIRSTAPLSSAWLIDVNDLPIGLIDIELSTPSAELAGDTAVVLLRPEQGPPAAVLKLARGPLRAPELRPQRRVLAQLPIPPRLPPHYP